MCHDMEKVQLPLLFLGLGLGEPSDRCSVGEDCVGRHCGTPAWQDESDGEVAQAECSLVRLPRSFR